MAGVTLALSVITTLALRVIQLISNFFLSIIFRGPNDPLVPIREDCLLESAKSLASRIRRRRITSVEAVRACIRRINDINGTSNSVVANRFEEAMKEAEAVDKFLAEESKTVEEIEKTTPFLGVPFTVKDGIAIKGLLQAAGVVARKNETAKEDAEAVAILRAAGAIPLAVTNVPELMAWWETNCKLHGRTKNPYHSQHMVGGSSGGEAALIASAGSMMGLGSDIGGSIRIPAAMCGVFGHKPSPDVVSMEGKYPKDPTEEKLGVMGPIAKFAEDLTPMLKVLSKDSKIDLRLDEKVDIKRLRYFYMAGDSSNPLISSVDPVDPQVKKAMKAVIDHFYKKYGITVDRVTIPKMRNAGAYWWAKITNEGGPQLLPKDKSSSLLREVIQAAGGSSEHTMEIPLVRAIQALQPAYGSSEQASLVQQGDDLAKEFQVRHNYLTLITRTKKQSSLT